MEPSQKAHRNAPQIGDEPTPHIATVTQSNFAALNRYIHYGKSIIHIVCSQIVVHVQQNVSMDIFANRLRERAQQLGISNSEAARRIGLEEGRYGHYIAGRREPDLATFKKIAEVLGTTPNWLVGVEEAFEGNLEKAALVERFKNAAMSMEIGELKQFIVQVEAVVSTKTKSGKDK